MSINVQCSGCGRLGKAPNEAAGKKIRCPACQTTMAVPLADQEEVPVARVVSASPTPPTSRPRLAKVVQQPDYDDDDEPGFSRSANLYDRHPQSGGNGLPMPIVLAIGGFVLAAILLIGVFAMLGKRAKNSGVENQVVNTAPLPFPNSTTTPEPSNNIAPQPNPIAPPTPPTPEPVKTTPNHRPSSITPDDDDDMRIDMPKNMADMIANRNRLMRDKPGFGRMGSEGDSDSKPKSAPQKGQWSLTADSLEYNPEYLSGALKVPTPDNVLTKIVFPSTLSQFLLMGVDKGGNHSWTVTDLKTGKTSGQMLGRLDIGEPYALHPNGKLMLMKVNKPKEGVSVYDFEAKKQAGLIQVSRIDNDELIDFGPKDCIVISNKREKKLDVWNFRESKQVGSITYPSGLTKANIGFSPGRKYLATSAVDQGQTQIHISDLENAKSAEVAIVSNSPLDCKGVAFSNDGYWLSCLFLENDQYSLKTWSMKGDLESEHALKKAEFVEPRSNVARKHDQPLMFVPNDSGWFVYGQVFIERKNGKVAWNAPFDAVQPSGPRRIIDAQRMLTPTFSGSTLEMKSSNLPNSKLEFAASQLKPGDDPIDVGLPPLVKGDLSQAKKPSTSIANWAAFADKAVDAPGLKNASINLESRSQEIEQVFFSSPESAQAVVTSLPGGWAKEKAFRRLLGQNGVRKVERVNLRSGEQDTSYEIPQAFEVIALSPSGDRILTLDSTNRGRIDVHDTKKGEHLFGCRPYNHLTKKMRSVVWADFLDEDKVLTVGGGGDLVLWSLPDFKAVYTMNLGLVTRVKFSPGRKLLALQTRKQIRFVDPTTGTMKGSIDAPLGTTPGATKGSIDTPLGTTPAEGAPMCFRRDGAELALGVDSNLIVIDMVAGKIKATQKTPATKLEVLHYCGSDFVLLNEDQLYDINRKTVVWNYPSRSSHAEDSINGQHWYSGDVSFQDAKLVSVDIPQPKVVETIKSSEDPNLKTALRPGDRVGFRIEAPGYPKNGQELDGEMRKLFTLKCEKAGLVFDPNAQTKFALIFNEKNTGVTIILEIRGQTAPRFTPPSSPFGPNPNPFGAAGGQSPHGPPRNPFAPRIPRTNPFPPGSLFNNQPAQPPTTFPQKNVTCQFVLEKGNGQPPVVLYSSSHTTPGMLTISSPENAESEVRNAIWNGAVSFGKGVVVPHLVGHLDGQLITLPGLSGWPKPD